MFSTESEIVVLPLDSIRENLLEWWTTHRREFPWRDTRDPYRVLIAEILLHRTRASQVIGPYGRFLQEYPDIHTVAASTPRELLEEFHSIGLSWRWRLLHAMAVQLRDQFGGQVPDDFDILVSLPGVSTYIASAVRCFAFGYADVLLDTNTVRTAGRITGLTIVDSSRRSSEYKRVLERMMDKRRPREFNFALIDFAALVCRSRNPLHHECCLSFCCNTFKGRDGERD